MSSYDATVLRSGVGGGDTRYFVGSFFRTIGAVNPGLTPMAHAFAWASTCWSGWGRAKTGEVSRAG